MSKIRDTDYLTISARVRAMENRLVTRERMERMVEARSDDEAVKVLAECGYEELPALTNRGLDELLSAARAALYRELGGAVPDKRLVELFQMKYDYHNAKALVKGAAVGADADRLLMEGGRWSAAQVKDCLLYTSDAAGRPGEGGLSAGQPAGVHRPLPPGGCAGPGDPQWWK